MEVEAGSAEEAEREAMRLSIWNVIDDDRIEIDGIDIEEVEEVEDE